MMLFICLILKAKLIRNRTPRKYDDDDDNDDDSDDVDVDDDNNVTKIKK